MIDQLIKNMHYFFLGYAILIGLEYYDQQEIKLDSSRNSFEQSKQQLKRTQKDLRDVKTFKANLSDSKARVEEVSKKIETIRKQLPSEIVDTEVNKTLTNYALDLKILNPDTNPEQEINKNFYFLKEYGFKAEGTFLQFLIFFEKLENLAEKGRILNVKSLKLEVSKKTDKRSRFQLLELTTMVEAYRYNKNYKEEGVK